MSRRRTEYEVNYRGKVLEIKFGTKRYYQYCFEKFKSHLIDDFLNSLLGWKFNKKALSYGTYFWFCFFKFYVKTALNTFINKNYIIIYL